MNEIFFAGGCLWGVQEFFRYVPGVVETKAGRANGKSHSTSAPYDGYAECVRLKYDPNKQSIPGLMHEFFKIIDPYSVNQQGRDIGLKYRTGVYSRFPEHLTQVRYFINSRNDSPRIAVEVLPLSNFVASDPEHQDRLFRCPDDYCHISADILYTHRNSTDKNSTDKNSTDKNRQGQY